MDLADQIRSRFVNSDSTLRELFARISFNILCGNTDDHGRNHAAFVRPARLELTAVQRDAFMNRQFLNPLTS